MIPADYVADIVLPTLAEFISEPDNRRRAYLACITLAHMVDHVARTEKSGHEVIRGKIRKLGDDQTMSLMIVEGICNGTKHAGPGRTTQFPFLPNQERDVPAFAWNTSGAGWNEGRWGGPGLIVAHKGRDCLIDDCLMVTIRAFFAAYPALFKGLDVGLGGP